MQTGTKISLAGHGLLLSWVAFGAWFPSEPLPFEVQEVSLISAEEFERLSQTRQAPQVEPEASTLQPPQESAAPEVSLPPQQRPEPEPPTPEPLSPPVPDPVVAETPEQPPEPAEPEVPDTAPGVPEPPETTALVAPQPEVQQQRPVDRVAPVPVAPPEPDTAVDEIEQPEVSPDVGAETEQEVQEATAPEAASDRIVTEENESDEQTVTAPEQSLRPRGRPIRRAAAPEPEPEAASTPVEIEDTQPQVDPSAVEDALAAALSGGADVEAPEPSGPPLTSGEKDALRVAVSQCWNVGSLSTEALKTSVVVGVSLAQDGKPDSGSIRMLSSTGGSATAAKQAYEAARRAIIRCGSRGFQLPPEKYAQWRDIEMTFNPERMRIK
ncbi:energy transducer TonB [Phaeobacter gallaeciensis]|uniref:energy transducer TonB n=1 Tax=Phaeobacter gallaeciensis TaxID=60890 RepID=UPI00237FC5D9|nr:energy transducer TonB [Phaeobacter gallaeciensis]MDE4302406.1 energy transducer TonB [Phaeobacter gallaeciensis]MDE4306616.1 energy transducer TonB [Phaeobacter gallaeciensis]MDE4311265.1 energy transducer TonB [Phaeobacter gallaeciensis]MDE4315728.1 energy transducer TonB [Phaeobacter gallaeciensis]MDE4320192.1 energy transducer TonB [Phaeobacter gallaeciensis]